MEQKVILTTKGNISGADKQHLRRCGIIIAEVKDINQIKVLTNEDYFDLDDIGLSAIEAIQTTSTDGIRSRFADLLTKRVLAKYTPTPEKIKQQP